MQSEYQSYLRKEVTGRVKYVILTFTVLVLVAGAFFAISLMKGEEIGLVGILVFLLGIPVFNCFICWLIAKRFQRWAGSLGPVLFLSTCLIIMLFYSSSLSESVDIGTRNSLSYVIWMQYLIYSGILSVDFFTHFMVRGLGILCTMAFIVLRRAKLDGMAPTSFLFMVAIWLFCEIIFYVMHKSQAKLFLALRQGVM